MKNFKLKNLIKTSAILLLILFMSNCKKENQPEIKKAQIIGGVQMGSLGNDGSGDPMFPDELGLIKIWQYNVIYGNPLKGRIPYIPMDPFREVVTECNNPNGFCTIINEFKGDIIINPIVEDFGTFTIDSAFVTVVSNSMLNTNAESIKPLLANIPNLSENDLELAAQSRAKYFTLPNDLKMEEDLAKPFLELFDNKYNSISFEKGDYQILKNEAYPNGYMQIKVRLN